MLPACVLTPTITPNCLQRNMHMRSADSCTWAVLTMHMGSADSCTLMPASLCACLYDRMVYGYWYMDANICHTCMSMKNSCKHLVHTFQIFRLGPSHCVSRRFGHHYPWISSGCVGRPLWRGILQSLSVFPWLWLSHVFESSYCKLTRIHACVWILLGTVNFPDGYGTREDRALRLCMYHPTIHEFCRHKKAMHSCFLMFACSVVFLLTQ